MVNKSNFMELRLYKDNKNYIFLFFYLGYTERAFACYQAMIELNIFCPDIQVNENNKNLENLLEDLELFWDSEIERFGELVCYF